MIRKISKVASQLIPRASADDSLARHEDKAIFDSVFYLYKDGGLERHSTEAFLFGNLYISAPAIGHSHKSFCFVCLKLFMLSFFPIADET